MQRIVYHPLFLITISALCIGLWLSLWQNQKDIRASRSLVTSLEGDVATQRAGVAELQKKLDNSKNPLFQEQIIRDQLLMQKPGEYILQLPDISPKPVSSASIPATPTPWEEWMKILLKSE